MTPNKHHSSLESLELSALQPEKIGFSSTKLRAIDALFEIALVNHHIPGAVALVGSQGQAAYFKSVGLRCIEKEEAMQKDDIFAIASMTKAITTVAAMMLYEEGKFLMDQPVYEYLPEFKAVKMLHTQAPKQAISIFHLLTHTSGIGYPFLHEPIKASAKALGGVDPSRSLKDNMSFFAQLPLLHSPGAQWTYGYSTDILGRLIEIWSGQKLDQFFQKRIFEPLGMQDTHFTLPVSKMPRLVTRYIKTVTGKLLGLPKRSPGMPYLSGGGGLVSTALDYAKLLEMLLNQGKVGNQQLLSPMSIKAMTSNQIGKSWVQEKDFRFLSGHDKFGLGFLIYTSQGLGTRPVSPGSYGWLGSYNTWYWVDPKKNIYGILLTQVLPLADKPSTKLFHNFQDLVYEAML